MLYWLKHSANNIQDENSSLNNPNTTKIFMMIGCSPIMQQLNKIITNTIQLIQFIYLFCLSLIYLKKSFLKI